MREISISGRLKRDLLSHFEEARFQTDELFQVVRSHALYERPIVERHRIVFYLGHIEAFDWNLICAGRFGMKSFHSEFDRLFAFGIDPINGNLPDDQPADWPGEAEIHAYNRRVRNAVDQCLDRASSVYHTSPSRLPAPFHCGFYHQLFGTSSTTRSTSRFHSGLELRYYVSE